MSQASTTQSTYVPGEGPLGEAMSIIKTLVDTAEMEATLAIRSASYTDLEPEGYKAENMTDKQAKDMADQLLTKLALKQVSRKIGMKITDKTGDGFYNVSVRIPQSLVESSGVSLEDLADEGACEIGKLRALRLLTGSRDGLTVLAVQERLTETFRNMLMTRLRSGDTRDEWLSAYMSVPRQQLLDDLDKIEGGNRRRYLERTAQGKKPSGGSRILPTFKGLSRHWLGTHHGGKTIDSVMFEPLRVTKENMTIWTDEIEESVSGLKRGVELLPGEDSVESIPLRTNRLLMSLDKLEKSLSGLIDGTAAEELETLDLASAMVENVIPEKTTISGKMERALDKVLDPVTNQRHSFMIGRGHRGDFRKAALDSVTIETYEDDGSATIENFIHNLQMLMPKVSSSGTASDEKAVMKAEDDEKTDDLLSVFMEECGSDVDTVVPEDEDGETSTLHGGMESMSLEKSEKSEP